MTGRLAWKGRAIIAELNLAAEREARAAQQEAIRELWTALDHLLAHTEHKGDAAKLLAVGKSEIVLAKYKPEGK